ncbi:MAG: hypothetical protein KDB47_06925 [Mycobacterium sp.]|nr:hypothetical protein [Mycobacterium sp.]
MTGKFAVREDVTARFEEGAANFPADRLFWVDIRIVDVENALMGQVASLRKPVEVINAESAAVGDPDRLRRVTTLVCDKVLDMYRNPERVASRTQTMGEFTDTRSFGRAAGLSTTITFTDDELDTVRLRKSRRKVGIIPVAPWRIAR